MTNARNISANASSAMQETNDFTVFKIPIGKLGVAGTLLISVVCGSLVFFVTFFLSIVGVTIYDSATGKSLLNLDISYRYIAAPVGAAALLISMTYLLSMWARHKFSHAE